MFKTRQKIEQKFNDKKIVWAIGASILLNHHNLVEKPNDIDILVCLNDIEKADKILTKLGKKLPQEKTDIYATQFFEEYIIDSIDVDVMGGFTINHAKGCYEYPFNENSIVEYLLLDDVQIPLTSLEDWYVIYQLIPNRALKAKLIEDYFYSFGVKNRDFLERALSQNLPPKIKENIFKILNIGL